MAGIGVGIDEIGDEVFKEGIGGIACRELVEVSTGFESEHRFLLDKKWTKKCPESLRITGR
jgi:hypothetical protein